jgi:hypothetical protein
MKKFSDLKTGDFVNYRNNTIPEDVDYKVIGTKSDKWGSYVLIQNVETGEIKEVTSHTTINISWNFTLLKDVLDSLNLN